MWLLLLLHRSPTITTIYGGELWWSQTGTNIALTTPHHTTPHHTGNTRNYDGVWCPLAAIKSVVLIPVCVRDLNYNGGNWAGKLENINQIASRIIISPFLSDLIWLLGEGSASEGNYNVNLSAEIINSSSKLTGWL